LIFFKNNILSNIPLFVNKTPANIEKKKSKKSSYFYTLLKQIARIFKKFNKFLLA